MDADGVLIFWAQDSSVATDVLFLGLGLKIEVAFCEEEISLAYLAVNLSPASLASRLHYEL